MTTSWWVLSREPSISPCPFSNRYEIVPSGVIVALMALEISLIGPPRVARDGRPVTFDTRKAMALLAHLALAERPRSREALCELLWPGHDAEHARGALRRTLSALRKSIGDEWIETPGDSVALRARGGSRARCRALPRARRRGRIDRAAERGRDPLLRWLSRGIRAA